MRIIKRDGYWIQRRVIQIIKNWGSRNWASGPPGQDRDFIKINLLIVIIDDPWRVRFFRIVNTLLWTCTIFRAGVSCTGMSSWIFFLSLSCKISIAMERLVRSSSIFSSSFCKMLCRKGCVARHAATLATAFEVAVTHSWHSPCSSWVSPLQLWIDVLVFSIKLCSSI